MKLYTYFRSSAAYRVRIGLNIKGLTYQCATVDLRRAEHRSPDYRDLNPQQLVPTLIDGERALSQSLAILEYLDETYPNPPLLPAHADGRAQVRSMALSIACDLHPLNNLRVLEYLRKTLHQGDDAVSDWYRHWIASGFEALERTAERFSASGRYMYGDRLTLADVCLVPQWYNARRFDCDLTAYATLETIYAHLQALPPFLAARPEAQPDADPVQ